MIRHCWKIPRECPSRVCPRATALIVVFLAALLVSGLSQAGAADDAPVQNSEPDDTGSNVIADQRGDPFEIRLEVLTGGVWVVYRPEPGRQPVMGNGVIIDNGDHLVVIDGGGSPLLADRVIQKIKAVSDLPVGTLIITHWHGDHHLGAYRFVAEWPDLEIISQRFTREAMLGPPMDYLEELRETLPGEIAALKTIAEQGVMADGSPFPDILRGDFSDMIHYDELIVDQLNNSRVTPPDRVFEELLILDSGSRLMELRFFGRGNTAGDAVLWMPEERILITGDLVAAPTPFGTGSFPRSWAGILGRFDGLQPRYLVPGHGPVQQDLSYVTLLRETLDMIADRADEAVAAKLGPGTFAAHFQWADYPQRFHHDNPRLRLRFEQWFAGPVLEAAHAEASSKAHAPLQRD